jgi:hypothetical protein
MRSVVSSALEGGFLSGSVIAEIGLLSRSRIRFALAPRKRFRY